MRLGINCILLDPNYRGGINTYALGLLEGLRSVGKDHQFQIYVTCRNRQALKKFEGIANFQMIELPLPALPLRAGIPTAVRWLPAKGFRRFANLAWKKATNIMDHGSDIIYAPTTCLFPFNYRQPTLISMHDIQHVHFPEFFSRRELKERTTYFDLSARYATYIQVSCDFIQQDILTYLPRVESRQLVVIRDGIDPDLWRPRLSGAFGEFLFYPAQLWPHKDHLTVLRALKTLRDNHNLKIPLVLTGAPFSARNSIFKYIADAGLQSQVDYRGKVPFDELKKLYETARFVMTATLYESNSLTLLEGAAMGRPLVASKTPPNVELGERLRINFFPPGDSDSLARLLHDIWNDEKMLVEQTAWNTSQMDYFSWNRVANDYLAFCAEALRH